MLTHSRYILGSSSPRSTPSVPGEPSLDNDHHLLMQGLHEIFPHMDENSLVEVADKSVNLEDAIATILDEADDG